MKEVPVYSECVVGYRHWRIADWILSPMSVGWPWRVGVNQAKCHRGSGWTPMTTWYDHHENLNTHHSPNPACECGLYAMHEPISCQPGVALGAVAMWGNLRVHPTGVRAQFAQIIALVDSDKRLEGIAQLYEVPLVPIEMLQLEAERHGRPLPESIRPEMPPMGDDYPFLTYYQQALRGHLPPARYKRLKK